MATTKDYHLDKYTFPYGWFMIAEASELDSIKPLSVRSFGQDFALYSGSASGKVVLLDAYFSHMKTKLAAHIDTSYLVRDNVGTNIEGENIRCQYHEGRFGPDGKCNEISYHNGSIPTAAFVKLWTVRESLGAIKIWHDPEGGEAQWEHPQLEEWNDPAWVRPTYDHLGDLSQHPQEIVDNIADYGHFEPIHGFKNEKFEIKFNGFKATQRQCGPHRTLVGENGVSPILVTITSYHDPAVLISYMTGMYESIILLFHTPVDDGSITVWHSLLVKSPPDKSIVDATDILIGKQFQQAALTALLQDFEVWKTKQACTFGFFISSDGPFLKERTWYKQFYNSHSKRQEYWDQCEGFYVPRGAAPFTSVGDDA